jgi:Beta-glucosidase (SUN family)
MQIKHGGLLCNSDGTVSKPFPDRDYCTKGPNTALAQNTRSDGNVAFCQTVLPGNENMLIPTDVAQGATMTLSVPGTEYWAGTAAAYYVNGPGKKVRPPYPLSSSGMRSWCSNC